MATRRLLSDPDLAPRKTPSQARARQTVEIILEGAARILRRGDALTTNHVAEEAGVSVGSLYQYFPNAPAIIAALIERHVGQEIDETRGVLARSSADTRAWSITALVDGFVAAHARDPALARAIHTMAASFGLDDSLAATRDAQSDAIAKVLGTDVRLTRLTVAAIEGAVLAELSRGPAADLTSISNPLVRMSLAALSEG